MEARSLLPFIEQLELSVGVSWRARAAATGALDSDSIQPLPQSSPERTDLNDKLIMAPSSVP